MYSKLKSLVFGVGVNDSLELTKKRKTWRDSSGVKKEHIIWEYPFYRSWYDMLRRSYSEVHKNKSPAYREVTCCEEWLLFSNYKAWMELNKGDELDFKGKKKHLDKDIINPNSKVYCPENCSFVSRTLNGFVIDPCRESTYKKGVSRHVKDAHKKENAPFIGRCSNPFYNGLGTKREFCRTFKTELEAHNFWRENKHQLALKLATLPCTPPKLLPILQSRWACYRPDGMY